MKKVFYLVLFAICLPVLANVKTKSHVRSDKVSVVSENFGVLNGDQIDENQFREVPPGGEITFFVSELNSGGHDLKVIMKATREYRLAVTNVNYETREITAKLPDNYLNDLYQLYVATVHKIIYESDPFYLDQGEINYKGVQDYTRDSMFFSYKTLLMPAERFFINVILDRSEFENYTFALCKSGVDYELGIIGIDRNAERVCLQMPNISKKKPKGGEDFKLLIKKDNEEYQFDLKNEGGGLINVVVAETALAPGKQ